MNKQEAKAEGRRIARGFGLKKIHYLVISEDTRTGEHFVLAGYPSIGSATKARDHWEKEYKENPFGAQPYMRVTVEEA